MSDRTVYALTSADEVTPTSYQSQNQMTRQIRALREKAQQRWNAKEFDFELVDATAEMREVFGDEAMPVKVTFRALTYAEMIKLDLVPDALKDDLERFNTELAVHALENTQTPDESDDAYQRRVMADVVRELGASGMTSRNSDLRDATLCICSEGFSVPIVDSLSAIGESGIFVGDLSEDDRNAAFQAIQDRLTRGVRDDLKSVDHEPAPAGDPLPDLRTGEDVRLEAVELDAVGRVG